MKTIMQSSRGNRTACIMIAQFAEGMERGFVLYTSEDSPSSAREPYTKFASRAKTNMSFFYEEDSQLAALTVACNEAKEFLAGAK